MESLDSFILFLHIVVGAFFVVNVVTILTVIGPAMSKIPAGEDKLKAGKIVQGRAQPAMDTAIIIQTLTVIYLAFTRWDVIIASEWMMVKVTFGVIALTLANLLHFYWRGQKRKLKADGKMEQFTALNSRTLFLEKIVLVTAATAFLLGVAFNHL